MKKIVSIILCACMLLCTIPVAAYAQSEILNGDYVVIVNTNPDPNVTESTGAIVFNSSGDGGTTGSSASASPVSTTPVTPGVTGTASTATKTYAVNNTITVRGMNYTCVAVGSKCYVWMETSLKNDYDAAGKTTRAAQEMINVYEGKPYQVLNTLANGRIPYNDGADKLSILMECDPESTAAGYYGMESEITAIHINCPSASSYMSGSLDGRNGLLAHEGQHAVFQLVASQGYSTQGYRWIDEGLAVTAMEWTWGKQPTSQWLSYIEGSSEIKQGASLVYENYRSKTALDYSLPALYVRYLANRYAQKYAPLLFMQELYKVKLYKNSNADNQKTVEEYLNDVFTATGMKNTDGTTLTFRQSLVDFYVAAVKQDVNGIYGFYGDTTVYNSVKNYPVYMGTSGAAVSLAGTAAIVVKTVNGSFTVPSSHGSDIQYIAVNKTTEPFRPASGDGTAANPFVLTTAEEFAAGIDQYPDAYFELANDIDMSKIVCSGVDTFSGVLDGKGYTLSGVARAIIYENNGTVKNLNLIGAANDEYLGTVALVAELNNGMVQDCTVSGTMTPRVIGAGIRYTPVWGSLVAINSAAGTVERCASTADVTVKIDANVSHDTVAGNLIGQNAGVVRDCFTAGSLTVTRLGNSTAAYYVGGIAGVAKGGMSNPFYRCYSVTDVTSLGDGGSANANIGRFAGSFPNYVYTEDCYSLSGTAALGYRASNAIAVTEKSSAELKTQSTFTNWNFSGVWKMPSGSYPAFISQSDITSVEAVGESYIFIGQKLDYLSLWGVQIKINGDSSLVDMTEDMVNAATLDSSTAGTKTVSCAYRGKSFTLTVHVSAPSSVTGLTVYQPGKTAYVVGSMYDDSSVVLSAKLNGATYASYIYSGFTNNKPAALTLGDTSITYTYCSQTVSQAIFVNELGVDGINIVSTPDKSSYASGENLSLSNLGVKLSYNDGTITSTLEFADLQSKGISLAMRSASGTWSNITLPLTLSISDNNAEIYLYSGDTLPSDSNSVIRGEVMTLTVQERMSLDDQVVVLKLGKAWDYAETQAVKGSGNVTVTKVSGTIPAGVSVNTPYEVGNEYDYFSFSVNSATGLSGSVRDYPLVYKITNQTTGQELLVNITLSIQNKSSVASFEYVKFKASQNSGILTEDVNGVIDSESRTVTMTVPYGTTSQNLTLEYRAAEGGSVYKPNGDIFFNGSYNFASTNPVPCKVVAEDGTTKAFDIYLVVAPEHIDVPPTISGITNGSTYCLSASFTVSGESITSVTDNGAAIAAPYTVTTAGAHKIIATNAGGSTEVNFTLNAAHTQGTAANCHAKAVCSVCSQSYGELNAANHDGATELRNAVAATCNAAGYTGDTYCLGCNKVKLAGSVIAATGAHTWAQTSVVPATCHTYSVTSYKCSVCNETKTVDGTAYDAANHDGETEVRNAVAATCGAAGYTGDTYCLGCNKVKLAGSVIAATGAHTWVQTGVVPATCHTYSVTSYKCSVCNATKTVNGTAYDASNHDGATEIRNAVAATCGAAGNTGDTYCLGCNKVKFAGSVIAATGNHTWLQTSVVPATCHTYSVTSYKCSVCNETETVNGTVFDASNHDGGTEIRGAVAATCKQEGYTGDTYCKGCNAKLSSGTVIAQTNNHTVGTPANCHAKAICAVCNQPFGELDAANHDGETEVRNAKTATCGAAGYTGDTYCLGCNEIILAGTATLATGNHTWAQTSVVPATCHTYSVTSYKCSVCNATKTVNGTAYDASNHDGATEIRNAVAATCGAAGYTGDTYCLGCNKVKLAGTAIAATGNHTWVQTGVAPATCHTYSVTSYKCSVCNETETVNGTAYDAANHDGGTEIRNAVAATCKQEGYTGDTYCLGCNTVIATGTVVTKTNNHTPEVRGAVKATCISEGYTGDTYCKVCDTKLATGSAIAKTAHTQKTAATCCDKAVCAVCSQPYGELNPNNHVSTHIEGAYDATFDSEGYTGNKVCDGCRAVVEQGQTIAKKNCSCMCHKTGFMGFIYKIALFFWKIFGSNKTCACGAIHY